MRINNNISAMNTYSRLNSANNAKSGSLAKLSSGLRINRAGDDAAGLAISEKMRGQIGGLKQATRNAQDGISLIQTAEGGLNETHSILNRMRELAVQSSNDTNTGTDRDEIQKEMDELSKEITRISKNTEFNTQRLLGKDDTTQENFKATFHIGANKGQKIELSIDDMSANSLEVEGTSYQGEIVDVDSTNLAGVKVQNLSETNVEIITTALGDKDASAVTETTATFDKEAGKITLTLKQGEGDGTDPGAIEATKDQVFNALKALESETGLKFTKADDYTGGSNALTAIVTDKTATAATVKTADENKGIDVSTQEAADSAIETISNAIDRVSAERSKLGATQNRLDHTINNLTATAENLSEAESRIRDVDMAEEMMDFTKNNILSQAATSMLAQANQMPQSVLQLLQ